MKKILLLLLVFLTASLHAQKVRRMERPPASAMPHGMAHQSTALSAASRTTAPPMGALPAFSVTDRDGRIVPASSLVRRSHWLLLYSRQNCIPCDKLLTALAASDNVSTKRGSPYVIIVDAPDADALERVRASYPSLSDAAWVADSGHQASAALKLKGAPMLFALHGSAIEFHVPGTLGDTAAVKNLATSWLTKPDAAGRTEQPVPSSNLASPSTKP